MTKLQLIAAVVGNTQRSDKTAIIATGIDLGLVEICARHSFKQHRVNSSAALVADESTLSLPTDCLQLIGVRVKRGDGVDTADQPGAVVDIKAKAELVQLYPDLTDAAVTGVPKYCYEENGVLTFLPKANLSYEIQITYDTLEVLTSDEDTVNATMIDSALIAYATAYLFRSISMFQSAQVFMAEYERALFHIILSDERRPGKIMQMQGAAMMCKPKEPTQWNENVYTES